MIVTNFALPSTPKATTRLLAVAPLFALGQVFMTPGAMASLARNKVSEVLLLARHVHGDWSEMHEDDQETNLQAIEEGGRVLSAFAMRDQTKIWVITEADRSVTTLLLPEEY